MDVLPDWLDKETWDEFVAHRKEKKKPVTPQAQKLLLKVLEENKADQTLIMEKAIFNGWTGLFPLPVMRNRIKEPEVGSVDWHLQKMNAANDEGVVDVECE